MSRRSRLNDLRELRQWYFSTIALESSGRRRRAIANLAWVRTTCYTSRWTRFFDVELMDGHEMVTSNSDNFHYPEIPMIHKVYREVSRMLRKV